MAEPTVIQKWSQDIEAMESEYKARWKTNLDAMRASLNSFEAKFTSDISKLQGDTKDLEVVFKKFAKSFEQHVEEFYRHIWGTEAEKEAWQRRFGR